jgi:methionyl-tRNA formyltransferase
MTVKPDAGDLMDAEAVPIGPDDTAVIVADRVASAAVTVLTRSLPKLLTGELVGKPLDLKAGSYFSGRKPADGAFFPDWSAKRIHDLVRAVAPPFPGAFVELPQGVLQVFKTQRTTLKHSDAHPSLRQVQDTVQWRASDGECLIIVDARFQGERLDASHFKTTLGTDIIEFT